jgi:hypothetical protein
VETAIQVFVLRDSGERLPRVQVSPRMEGYLSKKSIYINELFLHVNYIDIMVNLYSIITANMCIRIIVTHI